jgi:hypothetical protein
MRNSWILFLFLLCAASGLLQGQTRLTKKSASGNSAPNVQDSTRQRKSSKIKKPVAAIEDYQIVSHERDTTFVDTTLSIQKEYKFNYLRRDRFGLMQFANVGQTYNSLTIDTRSQNSLPLFAGQARHFNYFRKEDMRYFSVPTPFTELYWKTAFEQGQTLDAFFTVNTNRRLNFSVAYKGLRSLGNYQNALTSTGNFRFTTNYQTENGRYKMRGHVVFQDLLNEENGGLRDEDLVFFTSGNEEFLDRSLFDPNLDDAENILVGRRFHLDHSYQVIKPADSLASHSLDIKHTMGFEDRYYQFTQQGRSTSFFGPAFTSRIDDKVTLEDFYTSIGALYNNRILGRFEASLGYKNLNYGYDQVVELEGEAISNRIKNDLMHFDGRYSNSFGDLRLDARLGVNFSQEFEGNYLDANIGYTFLEHLNLIAGLNLNSRRPNFNQLLFQSDYLNYNWDNQASFNNINTQQIYAQLLSDKWLNVFFDVSNIQNFTYFNLDSTNEGVRIVKPTQSGESIQYLRVKLQKEFVYGKFALDNTVLYQTSNSVALNVPEIVTRNTLYYTDQFFRNALKLQTGVIFNYFTEYHMNRYDPLLAEFYTQNEDKIGGFPRLDFFLNFQVRQTRVFFKAEHLNAAWTGYNYFSAPNHPFRDFKIRFGLVWNFFL